jgi:hypothetical protein
MRLGKPKTVATRPWLAQLSGISKYQQTIFRRIAAIIDLRIENGLDGREYRFQRFIFHVFMTPG